MGKPWSTILTIIIIITSWKAWPRSFLGTPTYSILTPWGFPQLFPRAAVPLVFPGAWPHTPWMKGAFHDLGEKVQPHGHVDYINILHMVCICIYIYIAIHRCTIFRYKSIYVKYGNGRNDLVSFCLEKRFCATCSSTDDPSSSCWSDFLQVVTWLLHLPKLSSFTNHQQLSLVLE